MLRNSYGMPRQRRGRRDRSAGAIGRRVAIVGTGLALLLSAVVVAVPSTAQAASLTSVSDVTVAVDGPSDAAGAWSQLRVDFTTSSTGAMNQTDDGEWFITLPSGTSPNAQGQVTDLTTGQVVSGVGGCGGTTVCGLINDNPVGAGDTLQVDLDGVVLPAAGTGYTVSVSTTADQTASTSSNSFSVVAGQAVSAVSVSVDGPSDAAGAWSQLRVDFTTSSTGAMNQTDDGEWFITLPSGTSPNAQGQVTDLTTGQVVSGVGGCGGTTVCGLINGNPVGAGDTLQVDLDGVVLPAAATGYTVSVSTRSDLAPVTSSNSFSVVAGQAVSDVTVAVDGPSDAAGAWSQLRVDFTTSSTGGMNQTDDGEWFITLPAGTVPNAQGQVTDLTTGQVVSGVGGCGGTTVCGLINGNPVGAGDTLQVDLDGVVLPAAATGYTVSVSTRSDLAPVTSSNSFSVVAGQAVSDVTVAVDGPSDAAGAHSQLRVDFTTSSTGGMNQTDDGEWFITLPAGTGPNAKGQVTDLTTGQVVSGIGGCGGTTVCGLINDNPVSAGDTLQVDLDDQVLPAAGTGYTVSVSTRSDLAPVTSSNTFSVVAAQAVSTPKVSLSQTAAGAAGVSYSISFTTSSTGAMNDTDNGEWFVTLPAGSSTNAANGQVTDLTTGQVVSGIGTCGAGTLCGDINGNPVGPGDVLRVDVQGITNVASVGIQQLAVSTTSDTAEALGSFSTGVSSTVSGTVVDSNDSPVPNAPIQVCPTGGGPCEVGTSAAGGLFSVIGETSGTYDVVALPPPGATGAQSAPVSITVVDPNAVTGVQLQLASTTVLPPGATLTSGGTSQSGDVPTLNWGNPSTYEIQGCKNGFGVVVVVGINTQTGDPQLITEPLVETPVGSGNYVAQIPALAPIHGAAAIRTNITCIPTIHLYPDGGSSAGGVPVLITGSGFTGAKAVDFGSTPAESFSVKNDELIEAVSPKSRGNVSVTVTLANGTKVTVGSYHAMSVSSVSTSSCTPSGGAAVISGSGFIGASAVLFGSSLASSVTVVSDSRIETSCPVDAVGAQVTVVNGLGSASGGSVPSTPGGSGGAHGTLTDVITCIGGVYSLYSLLGVEGADTYGNASVGADILGALMGGGGEGVVVDAFTLIAPELVIPAALVALGLTAYETYKSLHTCADTLIDPSGTIVDAHGVPISGASVTLLQQSDPPLGPFSAASPTSGDIEPDVNPETTGANGEYDWDAIAGTYEVTADASGCSAPGHPTQPDVTSAPFSLPPPKVGLDLELACGALTAPTPHVTALSVTSGPTSGDTLVDISGTGLSGATAVHFGTKLALGQTVLSPYAITAEAPSGASTVDVSVTTPGGTSAATSADDYTYVNVPKLPDGPTVGSVSPTSGLVSGGASVTITGANLTGVSMVSFGSTPATQVTDVSSTEVQAIAPAGALPGKEDVSVAGSAGASPVSSGDGFTYELPSSAVDAPTITSASAAGTNAEVRWIVASAQGGAATTGFKIDAIPTRGATSTILASAPASAASAVLTGLTLGATYEISVLSTSTSGNSAASTTTMIVPKDVTSTVLTASTRSARPGRVVTFRATIHSGGNPITAGHVAFLHGSVVIKGCASVAVSKTGRATCHARFKNDGTYVITARYKGTASLQVSNSASLTEVIRHRG